MTFQNNSLNHAQVLSDRLVDVDVDNNAIKDKLTMIQDCALYSER